MNRKLLLGDLVQSLQSEGFARREAEAFVRSFFAQIEQALFADEVVKVQQLGVFKLIQVDSRESVNVQTGERFEIASHYKLSFVPDASLKAAVNKDYSHLEMVELEAEESMVDRPSSSVAEELEHETNDETIKQQSMKKSTEPVFEVEESQETSNKNQPPKKKSSATLAWIIFAVILLLLIVWALSSTVFSNGAASKPSKQSVVTEEVVQEVPAPTPAPVQATPSDPADWELYKEVVIEPGQRLTLLSLQYYGNKVFWVYLYEANRDRISHPNKIKAGTRIRIPKAPSSIVNPKSEESLRKALELEVKYKQQFD